jgi:hypothetical protein
LDDVTINSLINSVTWMTADQALDLGFIDQIDDYQAPVTNSAIIKAYTNNAPAVYQRCINKILTHNQKTKMNIQNNDLIDKTSTVLDKLMNFFKKVINKQTITDKGTLHHSGDLDKSTEVYQDEDMTTPAVDDTYTTADGKQVAIAGGKVQKVVAPDEDATDDDDDMPDDIFKKIKTGDVKNQIAAIRAKLHAQNALLVEARTALETANRRLKQTREEVKSEIKSSFTPEGSRRSNKSQTEDTPFFAPQSALAQSAVKKAVQDSK